MGTLEEYPAWRVPDLCAASAHDPCDCDRASGIGYHEYIGPKYARLAVESLYRLIRAGKPYVKRGTFYRIEVEGMERLAGLEEYQVCSVYDVIYRPYTVRLKPLSERLRRRANFNPFDDAAEVP